MKANIEIGSRVKFTGCFMAATVLSISGATATIDHCGEIIKKRLSSLSLPVVKESYYDEQELAHWNRKYAKGDVIYAIIAEGENSICIQD